MRSPAAARSPRPARAVTGINVSALPDGTLTYSVTLTNAVGNPTTETATATLYAAAPSAFTVIPDQATIDAATVGSTGFTLAGATVGDQYTYSVSGNGGRRSPAAAAA